MISCPGRDAARSSCEALLRRTGTPVLKSSPEPRISSAPRREEAARCAAFGERQLSDYAKTKKTAAFTAGFLLDPTFPAQCAKIASSNSATMLVILIIGFTAGPAVSL
jgi:hypothetical protein